MIKKRNQGVAAFKYFIGADSPITLVGKIILFPLIIIFCGVGCFFTEEYDDYYDK